MHESDTSFQRGAIHPIQCLNEGWQLIKPDYWTFVGVTLVGILLASLVPLGILAGPMMCGIHMCLLGRMRGIEPSMNRLFKGFDHFAQSLIATLIMIVPMIVVLVPAYIIMLVSMISNFPPPQKGGPPPNPGNFFIALGFFYLVIIVMSIIIGVLFFFVYPLIVDRRLTGVEAIKTSIAAVFGNLGGVIGIVLLNALLGIAGVMCCYVGAIFVMPLNFAAIAVAYRHTFPDAAAAYDDGDDGDDDFDRPRRGESTDIQSRSERERIR
jgi:hypothetical protein